VLTALETAAASVAPLFPLERAVAVNPFAGQLERGFTAAVGEAVRRDGALVAPAEMAELDPERAATLAARCFPTLVELEPCGGSHGVVLPAQLAAAALRRGSPAAGEHHQRRLARHDAELAQLLDQELARWAALLVGAGEGPWAFPAAAPERFATWCQLLRHDRRLRRLLGRAATTSCARRSADPAAALVEALEILGLTPEEWPGELTSQVHRLPGFAGYARFCDDWASPDEAARGLSMLELVAMGVCLDAAAWTTLPAATRASGAPGRAPEAEFAEVVTACLAEVGLDPASPAHRRFAAAVAEALPPGAASLLVLEDLEDQVGERLCSLRPASAPAKTEALVLCCIDGRAEGLRRHLEQLGPWSTGSMAGFFGAAVSVRPALAEEPYTSAPVLLRPAGEVTGVQDRDADRRARQAAEDAVFEACVHGTLARYGLAETLGWLEGLQGLRRTLWPKRPTARAPGALSCEALELEARVQVASAVLGVLAPAPLPPVVLLLGHRSTSTANPHAASLDCGACGGHGGAASAQVAVACLNDGAVREVLAARGHPISPDTCFVAGVHDTTTDAVQLVSSPATAAVHRDLLERLARDLTEAGRRLSIERARDLEGWAPQRRAGDWAESQPEWGLAGNEAMVIGPRRLTAAADLDRRVFLHDYDAATDPEGSTLAGILAAPVVVASWINVAYGFSALAPNSFGAGPKALTNPLGSLGVLRGAGGDLAVGFPLESVADHTGLRHQPVRLVVAIVAPPEQVDAALLAAPDAATLVEGSWIRVLATPAPGGAWFRRRPLGGWDEEGAA